MIYAIIRLGITVEGETCDLATEAEFTEYNILTGTRFHSSFVDIGSELDAAVKSCSD